MCSEFQERHHTQTVGQPPPEPGDENHRSPGWYQRQLGHLWIVITIIVKMANIYCMRTVVPGTELSTLYALPHAVLTTAL